MVAKKRAKALVNHPKLGYFAKDIILRSLYNLGHHEEVIQCAASWSMTAEPCVKKSERVLWVAQPNKAPLLQTSQI